jgi:hypothetical protein
MTTLDNKKRELEEEFNKNKQEAVSIEEQMAALKIKQQENINRMVRLQGAFAVIEELQKEEKQKTNKKT